MTSHSIILDDVSLASGCGVDLFDGTMMGIGCGAAVLFDIQAMGGNTAVEMAEAGLGGAVSAAIGAVSQTGLAGDAADLLMGGSGVDTLCDEAHALLTGGNVLATETDHAGLGVNVLVSEDDIPATTPACDFSMSLILNRIGMSSRLATAGIAF